MYEAAQALYDRFLPLVRDHLESSPFARFTFTGHSLGGSLGTLLMLMFVRRGVIPKACLSPVYTFGSPAIFCEGAAGGGCGPCATECSGGPGQSGQSAWGCVGGEWGVEGQGKRSLCGLILLLLLLLVGRGRRGEEEWNMCAQLAKLLGCSWVCWNVSVCPVQFCPAQPPTPCRA